MARDLKLNLPSADDLFSTQEERDDFRLEKVQDITISDIDDFPDHPFQVKKDESMQAMVESVKAFGIQTPAVVRPKENGRYELISGHRRKMACELAGLDAIPCIVRQMNRDEAIIAMVDSNLQRELILPSEKAKSYKMRLEAMKRQGQRTDLTSSPVGMKLKSRQSLDELGEATGESRNQIHRYIRLTELHPDIMQMVDNGKMAFRPAVELSYLSKDQQQSLFVTMESEDCTPSLAQAIKMKKFSQENRLNEDVILSILSEEKPNQVEQFKMPRERISKYFAPGTPALKIEETILKALELYRQRERQRDNDSR